MGYAQGRPPIYCRDKQPFTLKLTPTDYLKYPVELICMSFCHFLKRPGCIDPCSLRETLQTLHRMGPGWLAGFFFFLYFVQSSSVIISFRGKVEKAPKAYSAYRIISSRNSEVSADGAGLAGWCILVPVIPQNMPISSPVRLVLSRLHCNEVTHLNIQSDGCRSFSTASDGHISYSPLLFR